jgi:hypothetical protein
MFDSFPAFSAIKTSCPIEISFFTVSGEAETLVSPLVSSLGMPICIQKSPTVLKLVNNYIYIEHA